VVKDNKTDDDMSEVYLIERQCCCGYTNKFREEGEFITLITGTDIFVSYKKTNKICEQCGRELK